MNEVNSKEVIFRKKTLFRLFRQNISVFIFKSLETSPETPKIFSWDISPYILIFPDSDILFGVTLPRLKFNVVAASNVSLPVEAVLTVIVGGFPSRSEISHGAAVRCIRSFSRIRIAFFRCSLFSSFIVVRTTTGSAGFTFLPILGDLRTFLVGVGTLLPGVGTLLPGVRTVLACVRPLLPRPRWFRWDFLDFSSAFILLRTDLFQVAYGIPSQTGQSQGLLLLRFRGTSFSAVAFRLEDFAPSSENTLSSRPEIREGKNKNNKTGVNIYIYITCNNCLRITV